MLGGQLGGQTAPQLGVMFINGLRSAPQRAAEVTDAGHLLAERLPTALPLERPLAGKTWVWETKIKLGQQEDRIQDLL